MDRRSESNFPYHKITTDGAYKDKTLMDLVSQDDWTNTATVNKYQTAVTDGKIRINCEQPKSGGPKYAVSRPYRCFTHPYFQHMNPSLLNLICVRSKPFSWAPTCTKENLRWLLFSGWRLGILGWTWHGQLGYDLPGNKKPLIKASNNLVAKEIKTFFLQTLEHRIKID